MTDPDAQPRSPYPHTGGLRPIPVRPSKIVVPDEWPSVEDREIGKRSGLPGFRAALLNAQPITTKET